MRQPTGTVTFLFTDIEGSTKLWEQYPESMRDALARHDVLMHQVIAASDGVVFKTMGDAFCAAFATAPQALLAAFTAQQALQAEPWPEEITLRVRMALHTGTADEREGDYFGPPLNRVARLLSTGHGGQVLVSQPTYELTRDTLPPPCTLQDLGAHALRDLTRPEQVYQLIHPALPSDFPPLKSLDYLPNNLPQQLTSFIGREKELVRVKDLLTKTRLLTLTGSGGCGKTRLSLQLAADVLDTFSDGVWLVELASITAPDLVPQAVASVLGVKEQPGGTYTQALTEYLKTKPLLLVLDNCEHVLNACANLANTLLRNCPSVKILTSSREGLGIAGELTYRVPSLSLPDVKTGQTVDSLSQYEAVQLFVERALFHKPEFHVTNANAPALASICLRLDGIPLGIELAAARVRSLSVEEINAKMDNQFRLLTGGSKTALPRQQTLRALIDWSYGLLTGPEKTLLCCLSVFLGGWTLEAAEAVCASEEREDWEVLDLLTGLVDKSLVITVEADGATRYGYLETVRQYARDRLAEGDLGILIRERHRDYFLALAEEVRPHLEGPDQSCWYCLLETEHDNLRQAITFCLDDSDSAEKGLRLGGALSLFWWTRGHLGEGRERMTALLSQSEAQARTRARAAALIGAGHLDVGQNDQRQGRIYLEESVAISRELEDRNNLACSLAELGAIVSTLEDYALARSLLQESLALFRELGNKNSISTCLNNLGIVAETQGDYGTARSLFEESRVRFQETGNKLGVARALNHLGNIAIKQGEYGPARSLLEEELALFREIGNQPLIASVFNRLGYIALLQGDFALARSLYEESRVRFQEIGNRFGVAFVLNRLGDVAAAQGDDEAAWVWYEEGLALFRETSYKNSVADCLTSMGDVSLRRGDAARARSLYEESLTLFRETENRRGIGYCFLNLGNIALTTGEFEAARAPYTESLALFQEMEDRRGIALILEAFAALAMGEADAARGVPLWGAAEAIGVSLTPIERAQYAPYLAAAREALGDEVFQTAWAQGRAMTWEQAVEYALGEQTNAPEPGEDP